MFSLTNFYKMNTYLATLSLSPKSVHASQTRLDTLNKDLHMPLFVIFFSLNFRNILLVGLFL